MHATTEHGFRAGVAQTVTDLPGLAVVQCILGCVGQKLCSSRLHCDSVIKNPGRKKTINTLQKGSTLCIEGWGVGPYRFINPFVPSSLSPWCFKLPDTGVEASLEKKHLFIWLRLKKQTKKN